MSKKLHAHIALLQSQIAELKKSKKYGLVFEEHIEDVVLECESKIPILKEVKNRKIVQSKHTMKNSEGNLLIEGDNYHALSALNYTHKGKIDVIYIDPPYNTGNKDFIYNDNYVDKEDSFRHSKWLSFMEKRLRLAKDLLKDSGVIFISIDDNEQAQLKLLCDSVFGESNFIDNIIWVKTENIKMDSKFLSSTKDHILIYRKNDSRLDFNKEFSDISRYKFEDEKGKYYLRKLDSLSSSYSRGMDYVIEYEGKKYYAGGSKEEYEKRLNNQILNKKAPTWLWSESKYNEGLKNSEIVFKNGNVYNKIRWSNEARKPFTDIVDFVSGQTGQKELDEIFGERVFDHPKPKLLIQHILKISSQKSSVVLDFMAGSGTTGHAVLELNKEDGGNRQYILCTNNENNICEEVTYERLKRVIKGYTNKKGKHVAGLGGELHYYKTSFK